MTHIYFKGSHGNLHQLSGILVGGSMTADYQPTHIGINLEINWARVIVFNTIALPHH